MRQNNEFERNPDSDKLDFAVGGGRSKRRRADARHVMQRVTIAMTLTNGHVFACPRRRAWTGAYAVAYAGRRTTFVLTGVRE